MTIDDFLLTFGGYLLADNRWVIKAKMIPWDEIEGDYAELFLSGTGTVAKPARVAFGALIIKETLGLTDEKTVEQIRENSYLQHFLGYTEHSTEKPFDPSLMVFFRKRFGLKNSLCSGRRPLPHRFRSLKRRQAEDRRIN